MAANTNTEQFLAAAARADARSTGRRITANDALDWAGTVTAVLTTVGDGINVPQLKLAAGLAKQVIEVIQTVRENKSSALELGLQTFEYTRVIIETYHNTEGREAGAFESNLEQFNASLEDILSTLKKIALRKLCKRLIRHQKDKRRIDDAKSDLQHAFQRFNLAKDIIVVQDVQETKTQVIRTAERITIVQEGLGAIMQDAARVGEELDAGISQTNIGIEAVRAQVDVAEHRVVQSIESTREEVRTGDARLEMRVGAIAFDVQRTVTVVQQTQGEVREIRMALDNTQGNDSKMRKQISQLERDVRVVQILSVANGLSIFFLTDANRYLEM